MQAARAAFFLLLFANLIFFAWAREYSGTPGDTLEPQRLAAQLSPEKIHIIGGSKEDAQPTGAVSAPAAGGAGQAMVADTASEHAPDPAAVEVCREVAALPLDQADKLKAALAASGLKLAVSLHPLTEPQSYWVYLPPLHSRKEADKKAADLKKLGATENYVVQDEGPNQYAISLGLFKSEQAAKDFRDRLAKKGIRGIDIQVREKTDKASLELRGSSTEIDKANGELLKAGTSSAECGAR